jgi:hypothetical protein
MTRLLLRQPRDFANLVKHDILPTEETAVDDKVTLDAVVESRVLGIGCGVGSRGLGGRDEGGQGNWYGCREISFR